MSTDWPAGIVARPIEKADVPAWVELLAAVEAVDDDGDNWDADDLHEELADPKLSPSSDTVGLWSGSTMVGYAKVGCAPGASEVDRVSLEGRVHPSWRRRGLGSALLAWASTRGVAAHAAFNPDVPGELHAGGNEANAGERALFAAAGFRPERYTFDMVRALTDPVPAVGTLEGVRVVPFDFELNEATRRTYNEAFRDHWGFTPRDAETWAQWMTGSRAFRAPLSRLALDGDQVVSCVLGYEYVADSAASGVRELFVNQVATLRPYRGRGLARGLLGLVLAAAAAEGYGRAGLNVDTASPTGALGLYEGVGFEVRRTFVTYVRPLGEPAAGR